MLEPHPVWTTLGLVKLLFSDENSRHFYMRFTPGKPPTSAIHFSTLSVYTRSYTQRLEKKSSKKQLTNWWRSNITANTAAKHPTKIVALTGA